MKVGQLKKLLESQNDEHTVYINVDGKLLHLEDVQQNGFNLVSLSAQVDFDIVRAEQSVMQMAMYSPEQLTGLFKQRAVRALGQERYDEIVNKVTQVAKEREDNQATVDKVKEELNNAVEMVEEPKRIKVAKKATKKAKSSLEGTPESILESFYLGAEINVEEVKKAKAAVGEAKAREIFNRVKRGK